MDLYLYFLYQKFKSNFNSGVEIKPLLEDKSIIDFISNKNTINLDTQSNNELISKF